ncbi:hypothetical protein HJC10_00780 [Corallococcus exiguus]|nr:hypothetical protein [Corallococcus exiguus]
MLRDAGFRIERVRMAQQPAEHIVKTLAPALTTWRFRDRPVSEVIDSPAMVSRYHVVGKLLEDGMMDAWMKGRALPTFIP